MRKIVPIYEYKCDDCGKITELLENAGNKGERKCAHCSSGKLKKQFSVFSAQVKEGQSKKCFGCSDNSCPHSKR
ncbi:MAG: zinc ribbon domain-containing protein [Sedimentisphaerales bacterium]